jgi:2-C-methyl-D-erythritol 2,4-cyclodiphosphate synthase
MRDAVAAAIGISREQVSIKATRGEGLGFVGREEGAAALAVATVERVGD